MMTTSQDKVFNLGIRYTSEKLDQMREKYRKLGIQNVLLPKIAKSLNDLAESAIF